MRTSGRRARVKKWISLGVATAVKIPCKIRVPMVVWLRLHGYKVKDRIDNWKNVLMGRNIHAAVEDTPVDDDMIAMLADRNTGELMGRIEDNIREKDATIESNIVEQHAGAISGMQADLISEIMAQAAGSSGMAAVATPGGDKAPTSMVPVKIKHEMFVSTMLTPKVRLAGKIDTLVELPGSCIVVERKTGFPMPWHRLQARIYSELLRLNKRPGFEITAEVWYSGPDAGRQHVGTVDDTPLISRLKSLARLGESLDKDEVRLILESKCRACPRRDCGVRWISVF